MSDDFYANLAACTDFRDVLDGAAYTAVPPSWYVAISDVQGSTKAIREGRYQAVNLLGASSIVAVLNAAGEIEIPFVFGGDGATMLVPPSLAEPTRAALLATQQLAASSFDLTLRVGMAPVERALAAGYPIRVAKFRPSPHYDQAMFTGGGLAYVEGLLKDSETAVGLEVTASDSAALEDVDFSGLECRWQDVPSKHGEIVSLLVLAQTGAEESDGAVYQETMRQIRAIYGEAQNYRPITVETVQTTLNPRKLWAETQVRAGPGRWDRLKYLAFIWLANAFFRFYLLPFDVETEGGPWSRYIDLVVETADYRKYDEILRLTMAGTPTQRAELEEYLAAQHATGRLAYGLHVTDRALLTCLVFERMGQQVHFVDAADGGYAEAARALKRQLASNHS